MPSCDDDDEDVVDDGDDDDVDDDDDDDDVDDDTALHRSLCHPVRKKIHGDQQCSCEEIN